MDRQRPFKMPGLGKALLSVVDGFAKLVWLKMLNISVRSSKFIVSLNLNRLARIISNCLKPGPDSSLREKLPHCPASGIANAAGLIKLRSWFRNGSTPAIRSGRRILRELPPPGVFTTATNPTGNAGKLPPKDRQIRGKALSKRTAAAIRTSARLAGTARPRPGRTTRTSTGKPLRALKYRRVSQPPSSMLPARRSPNIWPLPIGSSVQGTDVESCAAHRSYSGRGPPQSCRAGLRCGPRSSRRSYPRSSPNVY